MIRRLALLALVASGAVLAPAAAAAFPADATLIVSGAPDLLSPLPAPVNDSHSTRAALSASGELVAFDSRSDGLAADDDDDVRNVYVKDMTSGAVTLVSRATDAGGLPGEPAHADCLDGAISADGTHVAFVCRGPLDSQDANGRSDVYVRDLVHGTTTLASRASGDAGALGDDEASQPALDADGGVVAFVTKADNLGGVVAGNRAAHVYRRVPGSDVTQLVSRTDLGSANARDGASPSLSDDGQRVAFSVEAGLTADDANGEISDVYMRDFGTATIQLVSRATDAAPGVPGASGDSFSSDPMISGDGSTVVFESGASNFDPRHSDVVDIYRRRLGAAPGLGTTALMSIQVGAARALVQSFTPTVNHDGSVVAFDSRTTTVDAADTSSGTDVYVRRGSGAVGLASRADGPGGPASDHVDGAPAVDAAGTRVVMTVDQTLTADLATDVASSVVMRDSSGAEERTRSVSRSPGAAPFVNAGGDALSAAISPDGRFVAFSTFAFGLGVLRPGGIVIVVRDLATGEATLASREDGPDGAVLDGFADSPSISADGRRVAFVFIDFATNQRRLYVRDLAAGRTFAANAPDGSDTPPADSFPLAPSISDDGARVEFADFGSLSDDDADQQVDVYVRDVDARRTLLADRADGPAGAKANGGAAFAAALSGDGRRVAFSTTASLLQGDGDAVQDVYVRDLDAATTSLASVAGDAAKGDGTSLQPTISGDGSRVAFISSATNLGGPAGQQTAYVRDLAARTLTIGARADGGGGAAVTGSELLGASLSGDGRHVRFVARPAASIAPGAPGDRVIRVYERDLASGTTRLASRASGADGAPVDAGRTIGAGNQSAHGGCVVFVADGRALTPPASSDHAHIYLRAFEPDCGRPVPSSAPGGSPGRSRSAAVLSQLAVRPGRFHVGGRGGGARIAFRLDRASSVSLSVARLLPGRRAHGRCSVHTRRGRRCTVVKRVGRLPAAHGRAGANSVRFSGRVGRRVLAPGRYRLTATPAGGRSRTTDFIVVKAHAKHRGRR